MFYVILPCFFVLWLQNGSIFLVRIFNHLGGIDRRVEHREPHPVSLPFTRGRMGAGMPKSLDEIAKICSTESVWHNVNFKIPMLIKALKAGAVHEPSAEELGTVHVDLDGSDFWQIIIFLEDLIETKRENEELKQILGKAFDKFARAIEAYKDSGTTPNIETRAANALKILGIRGRKRRPERNNGLGMLNEYVDLICGGYNDEFEKIPPVSKKDAIKTLAKKHGFQSNNACLQFLRRAWTKHVRELEAAGRSHSWGGVLPGNPTATGKPTA